MILRKVFLRVMPQLNQRDDSKAEEDTNSLVVIIVEWIAFTSKVVAVCVINRHRHQHKNKHKKYQLWSTNKTFSLVNVQHFIRLKLMGTYCVHGRGRRFIFCSFLVSALHTLILRTQLHQIDLPFPRHQRIAHTDPSWQSTKTGYFLDFDGNASCCLDMYVNRIARTSPSWQSKTTGYY